MTLFCLSLHCSLASNEQGHFSNFLAIYFYLSFISYEVVTYDYLCGAALAGKRGAGGYYEPSPSPEGCVGTGSAGLDAKPRSTF